MLCEKAKKAVRYKRENFGNKLEYCKKADVLPKKQKTKQATQKAEDKTNCLHRRKT